MLTREGAARQLLSLPIGPQRERATQLLLAVYGPAPLKEITSSVTLEELANETALLRE